MAWCQVGTSPSAGKKIYLRLWCHFEDIKTPSWASQNGEFAVKGQVLGLVKRTPGKRLMKGDLNDIASPYLVESQRREIDDKVDGWLEN